MSMQRFKIPSRTDVSENNKTVFDNLEKTLGFVPNLYAFYAKNDTALTDYLAFQNRKSTLKAKEREAINLIVSQVNNCLYCLSAHTQLAKMNGFSDEQILELRAGKASFDVKLNALVEFTQTVAMNKGKVTDDVKENLFDVGYTEANLIDIVFVIGDKIISNYIHNIAQFEIDFPLAQNINN